MTSSTAIWADRSSCDIWAGSYIWARDSHGVASLAFRIPSAALINAGRLMVPN
jgi:hypothetical protein